MIFAPDGTVIDRDALRSVGFGTGRQPTVRVDRDTDTKTVEVINEDTGGTAGWHAHKADGRTVNWLGESLAGRRIRMTLLPQGEGDDVEGV